jgi:VIT1/CCC1 family predicted Fe2+/Mn2+ transporter
MIREELGLDPSQLGSPWGSAISSFLTFSTGAALPVLPYVLGMKGSPFIVSGALSLGALFLVGAVLAFLSNKGPLRGGLRMLIIGAAAAAVTNGIGRLVGISLS